MSIKITYIAILDIAKITLATIGIITTLYGVFYVYYQWQTNQKSLNQKVEKLIGNDTLIFRTLYQMNVSLDSINYSIKATNDITLQTNQKVEKLQRGFIDFIRNNNAMSKEDFIRIMTTLDLEGELKKKETRLMFPLLTQQESN